MERTGIMRGVVVAENRICLLRQARLLVLDLRKTLWVSVQSTHFVLPNL